MFGDSVAGALLEGRKNIIFVVYLVSYCFGPCKLLLVSFICQNELLTWYMYYQEQEALLSCVNDFNLLGFVYCLWFGNQMELCWSCVWEISFVVFVQLMVWSWSGGAMLTRLLFYRVTVSWSFMEIFAWLQWLYFIVIECIFCMRMLCFLLWSFLLVYRIKN